MQSIKEGVRQCLDVDYLNITGSSKGLYWSGNVQLEQLRPVSEANCSAFVKDLQVTLHCSDNFEHFLKFHFVI